MKDYEKQPHYFYCSAPVDPVSTAPSKVQEAVDFCDRVYMALFVAAVVVAVVICICY